MCVYIYSLKTFQPIQIQGAEAFGVEHIYGCSRHVKTHGGNCAGLSSFWS